MHAKKSSASIAQIILLILAGESVFFLPFVLPRIFRPTFLDVFELNNFQLGSCFSIYGTVALLSYLYGGATIFWQKDDTGNIRTGKIMAYDASTGKRLKMVNLL